MGTKEIIYDCKNCNCIELAEQENGGMPVKNYRCRKPVDSDALKQVEIKASQFQPFTPSIEKEGVTKPLKEFMRETGKLLPLPGVLEDWNILLEDGWLNEQFALNNPNKLSAPEFILSIVHGGLSLQAPVDRRGECIEFAEWLATNECSRLQKTGEWYMKGKSDILHSTDYLYSLFSEVK